jgi:hypothetical protein
MTLDGNNWNLGRRGEILLYHHLVQNGFTALDVSAAGGNRAPVYNSATGNLIAPDALMAHQFPVLVERRHSSGGDC